MTWISIKDKLPPEKSHGFSDSVLTLNNSGIPRLEKYDYEFGHFTSIIYGGEEITHWMEIPPLLEFNNETLNRAIGNILSYRDEIEDLKLDIKNKDAEINKLTIELGDANLSSMTNFDMANEFQTRYDKLREQIIETMERIDNEDTSGIYPHLREIVGGPKKLIENEDDGLPY